MDSYQNCQCHTSIDFGPCPFATNVIRAAEYNSYYRTTIWTGQNLQMTLMCIPLCDDIGIERHEDTDQFIRVEEGYALAQMGHSKDCLNEQWELCVGDAVFVPAGIWHNIINIGNCPLKLSTVYAPPHHPHGTIHQTKMEAMED